MPKITVNGVEIHYEEQGEGFPIVMGHSLTLDMEMYREAVPRLAEKYRIITIDFRGHGQSEMVEADYGVEDMMEDAAGFIREMGLAPCGWIGLSLGAMIALRMASKYHDLLRGMVILDTSAQEEPRRDEFIAFAENTRGLPSNEQMSRFVIELLISKEFQAENPEWDQWLLKRIMENNQEAIYFASLAVLKRENIVDRLAAIDTPTLVGVGEKDVVTPLSHAKVIHEGISGSELFRVPESGHLTIVENPDMVLSKIEGFFDGILAEAVE